MRKKLLSLLSSLLLIPVCLPAQDTTRQEIQTQVLEGDTIPLVDMRAVVIFPEMVFQNKKQVARYNKLVANVKKVYPFAKLVGEKLAFYRDVLDTISGEKERKQYMKRAEKELESQFGDDLRELTFSQGKILIKLVYRETGNSTFDIVKELRGGFTAFVWQTMATLFGYNLKTGYDPAGEDQAIEQIVLMIESGAL